MSMKDGDTKQLFYFVIYLTFGFILWKSYQDGSY